MDGEPRLVHESACVSVHFGTIMHWCHKYSMELYLFILGYNQNSAAAPPVAKVSRLVL